MTSSRMQPLILFYDLEDNPEGFGFYKWPLHITILPFFHGNGIPDDEVLAEIEKIAAGFGPIDLLPDNIAMYGPNKTVQATEIKDTSGRLSELHNRLLAGMKNLGCEINDGRFTGEEFTPHITHIPGKEVPGSAFVLDKVSVVKRQPPRTKLNKKVIGVFELSKTGPGRRG